MDIGTLNSLELKDHWMKDFFLASAYLELQKNNEGLQKYAKLQDVFPFSKYIIGQNQHHTPQPIPRAHTEQPRTAPQAKC
jgi:hypothetical protein